MILSFLNVRQMGYYAIALPFFHLISRFASSVAYVIYPRMLESYGRASNDISSTKYYFTLSSHIIATMASCAMGLLFLSLKYLLTYFLPQYIEALNPAKILLASVVFHSITLLSLRVLIIDLNFKSIFIIQSISIAFNVALNYLLISMGLGLSGVALATACSYIVYSFTLCYSALSKYFSTFADILYNFCKIYWPILYVFFIISLMVRLPLFHFEEIRGFPTDALQLCFNILVFSLLSIPPLYYTNRKLIRYSLQSLTT